jgi:hypothetical protein
MLRYSLSTDITQEYNYVDSCFYGCKPSFYREQVKASVWGSLLTHFIYKYFPSHLLEKGLKYNQITLLGFILTISMSFGESLYFQGLFKKYAKKAL